MNAILKHNNEYPVFGDMMANIFKDDFFFPVTKKSVVPGSIPSVNIKESDSRFVIELASPGMNKEDFQIEVRDEQLVVSAEKKTETEEKSDENYTRREFNFSSFERRFNLPENANDKSIQASYNDGVLTINIPKKEVEKDQKRIIKIS